MLSVRPDYAALSGDVSRSPGGLRHFELSNLKTHQYYVIVYEVYRDRTMLVVVHVD